MSDLRTAAQHALDALNGVLDTYGEPLDKLSIAGGTFEALVCRDAITALRAALAQPEPMRESITGLGTDRPAPVLMPSMHSPQVAAMSQPEPAAPLCSTCGKAENKYCSNGFHVKAAAPTVVEPVGWLEAPYGGYKQNPRYRLTLPPAALAWKIPLYATPPRAPTVVEPNPWREAVIDRLVVLWNLTDDNEHDPRKALADIERMVAMLALDPDISSEAQALIDRGRAEATPPRAALTDEQIVAVMESCLNDWDWKAFARAIEAAHGIGGPK